MAAAVIAAMVVTILLPDALRLAPRWLLALVEGLLLLTLIAASSASWSPEPSMSSPETPGRVSRSSAADQPAERGGGLSSRCASHPCRRNSDRATAYTTIRSNTVPWFSPDPIGDSGKNAMVRYIMVMHRVAVLALDRVSVLDLAIPGQVFGTARALDKAPDELFGSALYEVVVCGERSELTVTGPGGVELFRMGAPHELAEARTADTIVVPGARNNRPSDEVIDVIRDAHARGVRIASICSGAFVLAAAGVLDGRVATTHWTSAASLAEQCPRVRVDPNVLFVDGGDILTSAGAATGLDLCLHMVRNDFGSAVAAEVARHIVIAPQRDGGQAQFIVHREPCPGSGSLEPTMRWIRDHLAEPITLPDMAQHAGVSPRTLNRKFREQTGTTPLRWLLMQRVRLAQEFLETSSMSVEEIARQCGFGTSINMRQHFTRQVHTSPNGYRRAFQMRQ